MLQLCRQCQRRVQSVSSSLSPWLLNFSRRLSKPANKVEPLELSQIDSRLIRNFCIIAHVDHGKTSLSDRLLEFTGAIQAGPQNRQVLDRLKVERDRGITVKAQTVALFYKSPSDGATYLLNLVDTPGHSDFSHEVQRSVAASDGAVLLVDANDGVQAQTIANYYLAFTSELSIIPVINKIDLPTAKPGEVKKQLQSLFSIEPDQVLEVSAKKGIGIGELLEAIVQRIPPPPKPDVASGEGAPAPFKGLIVDSWFEPYKGAVCLVAAKRGRLQPGDEFRSLQQPDVAHTVKEVGVFRPEPRPIDCLSAGLAGYLISSMRSTREALVGDTIVGCRGPAAAAAAATGGDPSAVKEVEEPLTPFQAAQPMVFCGLYPVSQEDIETVDASLSKLTLNDASVSVSPDSNAALGRGWRLGFLGLLHMDVFRQRLEEEFDADVVLTAPSIPYRVRLNSERAAKEWATAIGAAGASGGMVDVTSAAMMPPDAAVAEHFEPMCRATVITPAKYLGCVSELMIERRGSVLSQSYIDSDRMLLEARLPLSEIIIDLVDVLKSRTSGFASFYYEEAGWQSTRLVKLVPHLNDRPVEELTIMMPADRARQRAVSMATKLAEELPRQQFLIKVQIKAGNKVLASSQVKPFRKDVLQKIKSGTDRTRRQKLLAAQREGKRRLRMIGDVEIPRDAFIKVLKC